MLALEGNAAGVLKEISDASPYRTSGMPCADVSGRLMRPGMP